MRTSLVTERHIMKKIRIWKVIVFSIITLGIYNLVWYILRQREMESTYSLKMPHWLWMLIPHVLTLLVAVPAFLYTAFAGFTPLSATLIVLAVLVALATLGLFIWWFLGFSRAAAKVIANRVPVGWAFALTILANPAEVIAYQYYFNRYAGEKLPAKQLGPSKKFKSIAIAVIVVCVSLNILSSIAQSPAPTNQPYQSQSQQ